MHYAKAPRRSYAKGFENVRRVCHNQATPLVAYYANNFPKPSSPGGGGGEGTPYNGLYGEAPPERGTFFRLQVYKRVGISQVEVF